MTHNRPRRSSAAKAPKSPSRSQIARERRAIRNTWSPQQRMKRTAARRQDASDPRLAAHIRFVQFLLAREADQV